MATIRGIHNVSGVGCHLSCALLILCHCLPVLREVLIFIADQEETSTSSSSLLALGNLLRELYQENEPGAVDPSTFFLIFKHHCNAYDLGDATRALTVLLKNIRTIYQETKDEDPFQSSRQDFQTLYEYVLNGWKEQLICGKKKLENGKVLIRIKRKKGPLSVPFPIDGSQDSIEKAIQLALKPTPVHGYNWDGSTGDYDETTIDDSDKEIGPDWQTNKQLAFLSLPRYFLLHLQRFEYKEGRVEATDQFIDVPLDLTIPNSAGEKNYQLVGGILHADEAEREEDYEGGHYTTLLRSSSEGDQWTLVDGKHVENVSQEKALALLSGEPGASEAGPTRGSLLAYSCVLNQEDQKVKQLLDRFQQSFLQATSEGNVLFPVDRCNPLAIMGKRLKIRWSGGKFYAGKVVDYDDTTGKHKVEYDDGDVREYKLHKKVVEWDDKDLQAAWSNKYST